MRCPSTLQNLFRLSLVMYTLYLYNNRFGKFSFILHMMLAMIFRVCTLQKLRMTNKAFWVVRDWSTFRLGLSGSVMARRHNHVPSRRGPALRRVARRLLSNAHHKYPRLALLSLGSPQTTPYLASRTSTRRLSSCLLAIGPAHCSPSISASSFLRLRQALQVIHGPTNDLIRRRLAHSEFLRNVGLRQEKERRRPSLPKALSRDPAPVQGSLPRISMHCCRDPIAPPNG